MDFKEYQQRAEETNESGKESTPLLGFLGEIGSVASAYKKRFFYKGRYPGFRNELAEELGDVLWYLANVAAIEGLSLEEIAQKNLKKAQAFFDEGSLPTFDEGYTDDEQFPRQFKVFFSERKLDRHVIVKLMINDVFVGDALTDNSYDPDGYRYHDAFHLAYVSVLGWSPVMRGQLRRKRKSNPTVDEVEDGARAAIVEEAISIFIFQHAITRDFFEGVTSIDLGLLKTIMKLAGHLEVSNCTGKQWQRAILEGYKIFRMLKEHGGGTVALDLDQQEILFELPSRDAAPNDN